MAAATAAARRQLPSSSARVAMIGAGQPARMTQQAALDLGIELRLLAAHPSDAGTIASSASIRAVSDPTLSAALVELRGTMAASAADADRRVRASRPAR